MSQMAELDKNHPLRLMFHDIVHRAVLSELPGGTHDDVENYVTNLLVRFSSTQQVFAIRDSAGRPISSIYEMLAEADVLLNADSFDRERQVHKHIGDYILFWTGINPTFLRRLRLDDGRNLYCDYTRQGKESYHVVSTFDRSPYADEAPVFRQLSERFEALTHALGHVREHLPFHSV